MTSTGLYPYINENIMRVTMPTLVYRRLFKQYGVKHIKPKEFNMELKINE